MCVCGVGRVCVCRVWNPSSGRENCLTQAPSSTCSLLHASFLSHRLQDLTLRDLEKQEREKAANSLEAFIFETQVRRLGGSLPWAWCLRGVWLCEPCPQGLGACLGLCASP